MRVTLQEAWDRDREVRRRITDANPEVAALTRSALELHPRD